MPELQDIKVNRFINSHVMLRKWEQYLSAGFIPQDRVYTISKAFTARVPTENILCQLCTMNTRILADLSLNSKPPFHPMSFLFLFE